jgi:ribonuclease R
MWKKKKTRKNNKNPECERILKIFRQAEHPLSLKELAARLEVKRPEAKKMGDQVRELVNAGELLRLEGGRYGLTAAMNLVTGRLSVHPEGFGFVIPDEGETDVFVNPSNIKEALHGDRVVVRVEHRKSRGRAEGRIIRVLERRIKNVVGLLSQAGDTYFITPEDEHLLIDLVIPKESLAEAQIGQVVVAQIVHYPTGRLNPVGKIIEVLGAPEDPAVQVKIMVYKYDLPYVFPPRVLREARKAPQAVSEADCQGRLDLREFPIITIDGETARDFDDGVALVKKRGGYYTLYVCIADVSHYVAPGSALDGEAYQRGTSVYFPNQAISMLPPELSTGICSLNPGVERLAVTAIMTFDRQGRVKSSQFTRSVIKSQARLTYNEVQKILEGSDPAARQGRRPLVKMLEWMAELCKLLLDQRRQRGSLLLTIPEAEVQLDEAGVPVNIGRIDQLLAHQIIEEFMIAANEAVSRYLGEPSIFRVHDEPHREKMAAFRRQLSRLGYVLPPEADEDPRLLRNLLEKVKDTPLAYMVQVMLLRSLQQARYSAFNVGHYGLASLSYTHFTSPIRRYPDLLVHRLLLARLEKKGSPPELDAEVLDDQAKFLSTRERTAVEAEREMLSRMQVRCLAEHVGEIFHGVIAGVNAFGFFVSLEEIFAEGLVRLVDLPDDYYRFQENRLRLVGTRTRRSFQVGDRVRIRVARVDLRRRHINLVMVSEDEQ